MTLIESDIIFQLNIFKSALTPVTTHRWPIGHNIDVQTEKTKINPTATFSVTITQVTTTQHDSLRTNINDNMNQSDFFTADISQPFEVAARTINTRIYTLADFSINNS